MSSLPKAVSQSSPAELETGLLAGSRSTKHVPEGMVSGLSEDRDLARLAYQNYCALVDRVDDAFGDVQKASTWLSTPSPDFDGETPLEYARKLHYNVEALEPVLVRMEHGVYV